MRPVFFCGRAAVLKSEPFAAKYHTRSFLISLEKGGCCISGVYLEASDFVRLQDIYIYIEYTWILLLHHSACWELCLIPSKLSKVCRDLKLHRLSQGPSESNWLAFAVVPTGGLLGRSYDKSRRSTRWSSTRCLGSSVLPSFFFHFASGIQAGHYSCPQLMIPHGATQGDLHGSFYPHGRVPARALV